MLEIPLSSSGLSEFLNWEVVSSIVSSSYPTALIHLHRIMWSSHYHLASALTRQPPKLIQQPALISLHEVVHSFKSPFSLLHYLSTLVFSTQPFFLHERIHHGKRKFLYKCLGMSGLPNHDSHPFFPSPVMFLSSDCFGMECQPTL